MLSIQNNPKKSSSLLNKMRGLFCCSKATATYYEEGTSDESKENNPVFIDLQECLDTKITIEKTKKNKCSFKGLDVYELNLLDSNEIEEDSEDDFPINTYHYCLPCKIDDKPTLVLDLDNTLVYPVNKKPLEFTHKILIKYFGKYQEIWLTERPFLQQFLDELHEKYEIVLFTAGIKQYSIKAIRKIDKKNRIKYLLDRRFCTVFGRNSKNQEMYVKNLNILGRDLKKTIIIDDRPYSYILNSENGQHIPSFMGLKNDDSLLKLKDYLLEIASIEDFRERKYLVYE